MRAWESEYELMCSAKPVVLAEEEQGWTAMHAVEAADDALLRMKWASNVPGSFAPERVIIGAIADMDSMGYDVSAAESLIEDGLKCLAEDDMIGLQRITCKIWNVFDNAKKIEGHPSHEFAVYDSFEKYLAAVDKTVFPEYDMGTKEFEQRTYYGWLAQIVGGAIGTAVEGYTTENIREAFGEIYDYVRKPNTYNDDITYEIAFLKAAVRAGKNLSSNEIASEWAALIPSGWSAEEWALKNIKMGIFPPESGILHNPYREWIGAQMRGAICGMVAPADPTGAARYAYMDGVVSHFNNGVLGEIFNAVMVSLAYIENDIQKVLHDAIYKYTPRDSEYFTVVDFAYRQCEASDGWEAAFAACREQFKRYNWIHAYPNAAAEVVALYFGDGSFDETMHISAMAGYDVDCNAAQIATVLGVMQAERTMDARWTDPIGDRLDTYLRGYRVMSITELAAETVSAARAMK